MSEDKDKQIHALRVIDYVEGVLESFKSKIIAHGEDDLLTSSFVLEKEGYGEKLKTAIEWMNNYAHNKAARMFDELLSFLDYKDTWPKAMFWSHFNNKLVTLGKTSVEFRTDCLFRSIEANDCTLFHEVCKLQPPAKVVKKMIEIIPKRDKNESLSDYISSQYNHLSRAYDGGSCKHPIHMVMEHGGSIELVRLLVSADEEGDTLSSNRGEDDSVYHVLVANKANHKPKTFSEILRYLVQAYKRRHYSALLNENKTDSMTPVALLWKSLKESGLSEEQILEDNDFTFLLKATCYSYWQHHWGCKPKIIGGDNKFKEIDEISLGVAFLICSPCFEREVITRILELLVSTDKSFLFEHDAYDENVEYPIFHILSRGHYLIDSVSSITRGYDRKFIVESILRLVPQCAQQVNSKGLLPLHVAADSQEQIMTADERLSLVRAIWQVYPEAVNTMHKEYQLPPFALPVIPNYSYPSLEDSRLYSGLSTTFLMLRQQPEMLSVAISQCTNAKEEVKRPTKRLRSGSI